MQDAKFSAALHAAKFTTKKDDQKRVLRRVQFQLSLDSFPLELAEWLGDEAVEMRKLLQSRTLNKFELPIDGYHAKTTFEGAAGNAEADADGIKAEASVVGKDEDEHEQLTLTFEAFPTAKLLTWIGSSLKEYVECDFVECQREIRFDDGVRAAAEAFKATIPKGAKVTMSVGGEVTGTIEGAG